MLIFEYGRYQVFFNNLELDLFLKILDESAVVNEVYNVYDDVSDCIQDDQSVDFNCEDISDNADGDRDIELLDLSREDVHSVDDTASPDISRNDVHSVDDIELPDISRKDVYSVDDIELPDISRKDVERVKLPFDDLVFNMNDDLAVAAERDLMVDELAGKSDVSEPIASNMNKSDQSDDVQLSEPPSFNNSDVSDQVRLSEPIASNMNKSDQLDDVQLSEPPSFNNSDVSDQVRFSEPLSSKMNKVGELDDLQLSEPPSFNNSDESDQVRLSDPLSSKMNKLDDLELSEQASNNSEEIDQINVSKPAALNDNSDESDQISDEKSDIFVDPLITVQIEEIDGGISDYQSELKPDQENRLESVSPDFMSSVSHVSNSLDSGNSIDLKRKVIDYGCIVSPINCNNSPRVLFNSFSPPSSLGLKRPNTPRTSPAFLKKQRTREPSSSQSSIRIDLDEYEMEIQKPPLIQQPLNIIIEHLFWKIISIKSNEKFWLSIFGSENLLETLKHTFFRVSPVWAEFMLEPLFEENAKCEQLSFPLWWKLFRNIEGGVYKIENSSQVTAKTILFFNDIVDLFNKKIRKQCNLRNMFVEDFVGCIFVCQDCEHLTFIRERLEPEILDNFQDREFLDLMFPKMDECLGCGKAFEPNMGKDAVENKKRLQKLGLSCN